MCKAFYDSLLSCKGSMIRLVDMFSSDSSIQTSIFEGSKIAEIANFPLLYALLTLRFSAISSDANHHRLAELYWWTF